MTSYEIQTLCDNCGRLVRCEPVDAATFTALAVKAEPTLLAQDFEEEAEMETGDLISEEEDRLVEIFLQHVPVCSHCELSA